jgi:hypothetical protein
MKQIYILTAFMLLATVTLKATVWTVSNDPNQPAQWSSLQIACDSASAGDTLYVMGTATSYGTIHVKKRLHLIGAGIKPVGNYLYGYPTSVSTIYLDTVNYISGSSGTIIEGLTVANIYVSFSGLKDIIIKRNKITSEFRNYTTSYNYHGQNIVTNLLIVNNIVVEELFVKNCINVIIMNNIISRYVMGAGATTIISNNLFVGYNSSSFADCNSSTISNNIFYYSFSQGSDYCTFSNNLGFGQTSNIVTGTNSGSNNIQADPKFLYLYSTTNHSYNDQNKYRLKSSSPGKNTGTDGTDIGIYGGQYPWPASVLVDYIHCIPPAIPMMQELNIQNSSVPANGTLNFSVKAYKSSK